MAINKIQMYKTQLESMRQSLTNESDSNKSNHVSQPIADRFNLFLNKITEAHPEAAEFLPPPITTSRHHKIMAISDATYLDLGLLLDDTIKVLSEIERHA
ncbi:hypothetical protein [Bremerella sp.]|uniref:hypothetical protein n=1 Tax=Bremerella sp. TaxID=2795602 RepID=UPI00391CFBC3